MWESRSSFGLGLVLMACTGTPAPSEHGSDVQNVPANPSPAGAAPANPSPASVAGGLKPVPLTPQQIEAYRRELGDMFKKPITRVEPGPRGTRTQMARIDGFTHATVAAVTADGKVQTSCAESAEGAIHTLTEPQAKPEEK